MRWLCLLLIQLSFVAAVAQKKVISGKVVDKANTGIAGASVCVVTDSSVVLQYGFTNEKGEYTMVLNKLPIGNLTIEVACLGYAKAIEKIANNQYYQEVILHEKIEKLQEVVVASGKKITIKTDTTNIKISGFTNNTEQTVEDVLRKLPGIEVTKDGTIKAHGKTIDKLLVEGEDIFDKNYKILSKNLDAKTLNEVQIIDRFEDNPVLKQLNSSDKVAINLKLKNNLKNVWFGSATVGGSALESGRYKLTANVGLLKKRIKFFYFNNYNNLGDKAADVLAADVTTNTNFGLDRQEYSTKPTYQIAKNDIQLFSKTQCNFNNAALNAVSFSSKLKKKLTVRGQLYTLGDRQHQISQAITQYNLPQSPFSVTENNSYADRKSNYGIEINLRYTPNDKNYYTNLLVVNQRPNSVSNQLIFNNVQIQQDFNFKNKSLVNHFNHTKRISDNCVLNNYLFIGFAHTSENANIVSPVLNAFLGINSNNNVVQQGNSDLFYIGNQYKLLIKYNKWDFISSLRAEISHQRFQYTYTAASTNLIEYQNNLKLKQLNVFQQNTIQYRINKRYVLGLEVNLQNYFVNRNYQNSRYLLVNPVLRIRADKTAIGNVALAISQNSYLPEANQLATHFQMVDYRSFYRGTSVLQPLNNQSIEFSHHYFNDEKRFSVTTNATYNHAKTSLNTTSTASKDFIFNTGVVGQGIEAYQLNCRFTNYIRTLQLASKIEVESNWMANPINVNDTKFQSLTSRVQTIKYSATSYFKLPVNVEVGVSFNFTQSNFEAVQTKNHTQDAFVNINYQISKSLLLENKSAVYIVNQQHYYFQNIIVGYQPINKKISYKLFFNNLFNTKEYSYVLLNSYTFYKSTAQLVPRFLLLTAQYRF